VNEVELLFSEILNCERIDLYRNRFGRLDKNKSGKISSVLKRRIKGEPLQYILGKQEFMGFEFKVSPDVFIPRPETEILVESITGLSPQIQLSDSSFKILEIGTGSGCIAVSLARLLPQALITAVDISEKALRVARNNARSSDVAGRIEFICSDLFAHRSIDSRQYDIIVSNPPYIVSSEIDDLTPEIAYEPRIGLDGGKDGLDFYRSIISGSIEHLRPRGFLALEIGLNQRKQVEDILKKNKDFSVYRIIRDYNKIERIIIAQNLR